ncbi:hypothetical protein RN001_004101 [Aquatica leii]|uniref:Zinc finger PHD-type domain-containing protein n=1 Tax=Aquatica leii TaxID=1421715 RepID=A0AAN7PGW8_9COLE|nr:hypothetical protein RN001_004101 [Aquatica leii]
MNDFFYFPKTTLAEEYILEENSNATDSSSSEEYAEPDISEEQEEMNDQEEEVDPDFVSPKVATVEKGIKGFETTSIFPYNRDIFDETDFMPSELLEVSSEIHIEPPEVSNIIFTKETNMKKSESTQNYNQPSCSFGETLQIISPKPTRPKQTKRVVRKKETSKILTSTSVKDALERQEEDRKKIVKPKPRTELQTNKKIKIVKSKPNRKEMEASTSKIQDESSEESDSAFDVDCLYCVSKYSASRGGEGWIQCQGCRNWAHEECAGIDDFEDEFLCLICNN